MGRKKVAVVGATGMAGQQLVLALSSHPEFEVVTMVTSREKKTYVEALLEENGVSRWTLDHDVPLDMRDVPVVSSEAFHPESVDVIFTAVESDVARELEPRYAKHTPTFSTASFFRMEEDTPLIIPGLNEDHADLLLEQKKRRNWKGFVLPIPNCTATGLAITLKPLQKAFGIDRVTMVSMQAVSGAGRTPGIRTLDSLDNIIPYIPQEEEKVQVEIHKILGTYDEDLRQIVPAAFDINCICTRVAVLDGHTEAVFVKIQGNPTEKQVKEAFVNYQPFQGRSLHLAPSEYIRVLDNPYRPQVRLDRGAGGGMTTSVGRVEMNSQLGECKYVLVSHNTMMGAGKGAVLLAECLLGRGLL